VFSELEKLVAGSTAADLASPASRTPETPPAAGARPGPASQSAELRAVVVMRARAFRERYLSGLVRGLVLERRECRWGLTSWQSSGDDTDSPALQKLRSVAARLSVRGPVALEECACLLVCSVVCLTRV
jgi:hypothetical protein